MPARVFDGNQFQRMLEPLSNALGGSDPVLGGAANTIATVNGDGLDGSFAATIGPAADADAQHPSSDTDPTAHTLVDAGAGSESYRQSVLRYLPQPDARVPEDYIPPLPDPANFRPDPDQNPDRPPSKGPGRPTPAPPDEGPSPTPAPAAPTPSPSGPGVIGTIPIPAGVDHLPSVDEVTNAYQTYLHRDPNAGDYDAYWSYRTDWFDGIANSDEARSWRAAHPGQI